MITSLFLLLLIVVILGVKVNVIITRGRLARHEPVYPE